MNTSNSIIISVGDYSGHWSKPWRDAGYQVWRIDPKLSLTGCDDLAPNDWAMSMTAQEFASAEPGAWLGTREKVIGCLFAPPCTDFAGCGSQHWPAKDADGTTEASLEIIDACMAIVDACKPTWWYLENPVGRLSTTYADRVKGKPMYVQPHHYAHLADDVDADRYTKKTGLWGEFDREMLKSLQGDCEPIMYTSKDGKKRGSYMWAKLGGKSERTKTLRSMTPSGLARATFKATQGWYK